MPPTELDVISTFATKLALRPDGERICATLASAFYDQRAALWPYNTAGVTREWIEGHVFEILATIERLYGEALCLPVAREFLDRMAWLPPLLATLDSPVRADA
jgi:hypothetical protein